MMIHRLVFMALAMAAMACSPSDGGAAEPAGVPEAEVWRGVLEIGGQSLRLELELDASAEPPSAVLVSLDQGGARIPMSEITLDGDRLALAQPRMGLSYEGRRQDGRIIGVFTQAGASADLVFEPGQFPVAENAPDAAAPIADPFEREMVVEAGVVTLAGTVRLPEGQGPFPGVVILSGSGPQDRDGVIAGQPVLATLARSLAEAGVASLRLDDRGVGGSSAIAPAGPADLAADAAAALAALRAEPQIACAGFVGHSEGGLIALLAAPEAEPDFIVTLAGMHLPMRETLYTQAEAVILASGGGADQVAANRLLQDATLDAIETQGGGDATAAIEAALIGAGAPATLAAQQARIWGQPYAGAALAADPDAAAAAFNGPLAAVFAANDLQVLPEPNAQALRAARAGLPTEVVIVEGVNHLFQASATGLPAEYGAAGHAIAPDALAQIAVVATALAERGCGAP